MQVFLIMYSTLEAYQSQVRQARFEPPPIILHVCYKRFNISLPFTSTHIQSERRHKYHNVRSDNLLPLLSFYHLIRASYSWESGERFRATDQLNRKGHERFALIQQTIDTFEFISAPLQNAEAGSVSALADNHMLKIACSTWTDMKKQIRKDWVCTKHPGLKAQRLNYSQTKPGLNCIKYFAEVPAEFPFTGIGLN